VATRKAVRKPAGRQEPAGKRKPEKLGVQKPGTKESRKKALKRAKKQIEELLEQERKGTVTRRELQAGLKEIIRTADEMLTHHFYA